MREEIGWILLSRYPFQKWKVKYDAGGQYCCVDLQKNGSHNPYNQFLLIGSDLSEKSCQTK